ncbi:MAG: acyl-ACP--UDP-N-acetylglucosamine O-acyltransferase [Pseudomonadota bacterium]|nr:acyl-ACP--UDP-N-acetylglucosamine O-acyltransferase [Pseudomonadota bacterium]
MSEIHSTAIVDPGAELGDNITVGPFCTIGPDVKLNDGCLLTSHVVLSGRTEIGPNCRIYPFTCLGLPPQDMKYEGEPSTLKIGANNIFREQVTVNPGTQGGGMITSIGNNCLLMVGAHVAHDCRVGNQVVMANNATLAGHVSVEDYAIIGGLSAIHQYCRVGRHAMVGGMSGVENDVIPYGSVMGDRAHLSGLNIIGMKRRGFSRSDITALRKAYRLMFAEEGTLSERLEDVLESFAEHDAIMEVVNFIRSDSSRAICQPQAEQGG